MRRLWPWFSFSANFGVTSAAARRAVYPAFSFLVLALTLGTLVGAFGSFLSTLRELPLGPVPLIMLRTVQDRTRDLALSIPTLSMIMPVMVRRGRFGDQRGRRARRAALSRAVSSPKCNSAA